MKLPEMPSYPYIGQDWDDTARLLLGDWGKACYVAGEKQERALWKAATPVVPPSGWADEVEQRLLTWRQRQMNRSGDQLALDDFMGQESIDDLIDFVCAPLATSPSPRTPEQPEQPSVHPVERSGTRPAAVDNGRDTRASDAPDEEDDDYSLPVLLPDNRVAMMRRRDVADTDHIVFDPPGAFASARRFQRLLNEQVEAAGGVEAWRATAIGAERYRWIRERPGYIRHLGTHVFYLNWNGSEESLDAAIDAAIAMEKQA